MELHKKNRNMQIKTTRIVALLMLTLSVGCSSGSGSTKSAVVNSNLSSQSDSLAYIVGMNIAEQLHKMDSTINYGVVCRAIMERMEHKSLMSDEEAKVQYLRYLLYVEPERKRGYEEQFLADLAASDRDYTRTKSGLTYHIEVIGDESLQPKSSNDWVVVNYVISQVGGEQLYPPLTSEDKVVTIEAGISELPSGVAESLMMIGKGGKIRAWIPSKLAYGELGNEEYGVEPTQTLHFDIELVDVEKGVAIQRRKELTEF